MQNWVKIILRDVLLCREVMGEGIVGILNERIMEWFAFVVNNVNFITWSTCDVILCWCPCWCPFDVILCWCPLYYVGAHLLKPSLSFKNKTKLEAKHSEIKR